jgi:hypothetical protein
MTLIIQKPTGAKLVLAKNFYDLITDADAKDYLTRVHAAEGQTLEPETCLAIEAFVVGCKADGIWSAIKASCILAGARTLTGALVPLVGTAPTNNNFVSGDYNRKTGLVGNGSTKYLDSNRNNNADPQNNRHLAVNANLTSSGTQLFAGGRSAGSGIGATFLGWSGTQPQFRCIPNTDTQQLSGSASVGTATLFGFSRDNSSSYTARVSGSNASISSISTTANNINLFIFAQNNQNISVATYSNARLAFYSIGESLNLALLDTRVTTLINAIAAAIP